MVAINILLSKPKPSALDRRLSYDDPLELSTDHPGHYVTLYLGESQSVVLQVDINTEYTTFPCSKCTNCGNNHVDKPFQEYSSSSAHVNQCSDHCAFKSSKCIEGAKECQIVVHRNGELGEEGGYKGIEVEDSVALDTSDGTSGKIGKKHTLTFICQREILGLTKSSRVDGVVGLANSPYSFVTQAYQQGVISQNLFSMCFSRGSNSAGSLTLGEVDRSQHSTPLVWALNTATTKSISTFALHVRRMFVGLGGGNEPLVRASQGTMALRPIDDQDDTNDLLELEPGNAVLEPNQVETMIDKKFQKAFEGAFLNIVGLPFVPAGIPLKKEDYFRFPTIFIQFETDSVAETISCDIPGFVGRHDRSHPYDVLLAIPPEHYVAFDEVTGMYRPFIGFHAGVTKIGWHVLTNHEVVFDLENDRIGFAERKTCAPSLTLDAKVKQDLQVGEALKQLGDHPVSKGRSIVPKLVPKTGDPSWKPNNEANNDKVSKSQKQDKIDDAAFPKFGEPGWRPINGARTMDKPDSKSQKQITSDDADIPKFGEPGWRPINGARAIDKPDFKSQEQVTSDNSAIPKFGEPGWRPINGVRAIDKPDSKSQKHDKIDSATVPKFGEPGWRPINGARAIDKPDSKSQKQVTSDNSAIPKFGEPGWRPINGARTIDKPDSKSQKQEKIDVTIPKFGEPGWRPFNGARTIDKPDSKSQKQDKIDDVTIPKFGEPGYIVGAVNKVNAETKKVISTQSIDVPKSVNLDWNPLSDGQPFFNTNNRLREEMVPQSALVGGHGLMGELEEHGSSLSTLSGDLESGGLDEKPNVSGRSISGPENSNTVTISVLDGNQTSEGTTSLEKVTNITVYAKSPVTENTTETNIDTNTSGIIVLQESLAGVPESHAGLPSPESPIIGRGRSHSGTSQHEEVFRVGPSVSGGLQGIPATPVGNGWWNLIGLGAFLGAFCITALATRERDTIQSDSKLMPILDPTKQFFIPEGDAAWAENWDEAPSGDFHKMSDDKTAATHASDGFDDDQVGTGSTSRRSLGGTTKSVRSTLTTMTTDYDNIQGETEEVSKDGFNRSFYSKASRAQDDGVKSYYSHHVASSFVKQPYSSVASSSDPYNNNEATGHASADPISASSYPIEVDDDRSFNNSKQYSIPSSQKTLHSSYESKPSTYPYKEDEQSRGQSDLSFKKGRSYDQEEQSYYSEHDGASSNRGLHSKRLSHQERYV